MKKQNKDYNGRFFCQKQCIIDSRTTFLSTKRD